MITSFPKTNRSICTLSSVALTKVICVLSGGTLLSPSINLEKAMSNKLPRSTRKPIAPKHPISHRRCILDNLLIAGDRSRN